MHKQDHFFAYVFAIQLNMSNDKTIAFLTLCHYPVYLSFFSLLPPPLQRKLILKSVESSRFPRFVLLALAIWAKSEATVRVRVAQKFQLYTLYYSFLSAVSGSTLKK